MQRQHPFFISSLQRRCLKTSLPKLTSQAEDANLTYEERNALQYAAGYIPIALTKKLKHSSHHLKEKLVLCLTGTTHRADVEEGISSGDDSEDWVLQIDRGGLKHVNSNIYMVVVAMELVLQRLLRAPEVVDNIKRRATEEMLKNEYVLFYWPLPSAG